MAQSPDACVTARARPRVRSESHTSHALSDGWQAACSPAPAHRDAHDLDGLDWMPASVPGTAAGALRDAGLWRLGQQRDFDAEDWWFRTRFDARAAASGEELRLRLDGIATVAEVYLDGELVLESESMFASHVLDLEGRAGNELVIGCRALAPLLAEPRRPRARWRTRLVSERNLRFYRTMLLGRAPGFAPGPAAVGPWRAVRVERTRGLAVEELTLRPRLEGASGVVSIHARLRTLDEQPVRSVEAELDGPSGLHRTELTLSGPADALAARGELVVPRVERWWPHTHGEPALHDLRLVVAGERPTVVIDAGRVGFRELAFGSTPSHDIERDGIDLRVNGARVFARGAVWTPIDPVGLAPCEQELRAELARVREAGMNMLRLPGTGAYETASFHDLCDELGILVWQDFMFANFDYPFEHERFRAAVTREAGELLGALGGRPSLTVLCGNSEVEQQVAMLGLDPSLGRGELFGELLPALVRDSGVDAAYVPSAPCGGELPFRPDRGIANYFGVGGYRRPLDDLRRAGVRFAAECLAFSNVLEAAHAEAPAEPAGVNPVLETGVPRDVGADWDFADVRDHYLEVLFDLDARELRMADRERYLELSRAVTGEVMCEAFGEWRRSASPCGGALVLWLRDLLPGAGWGVIDCDGVPKLAYHHLRRALAPVAVWTVDEGLGGIVAHVANDRPVPLEASLRVALYRDRELRIEEAAATVALAPHTQGEWNVEAVIGRFVDAAWAYRFGPPAQDAIVVSLERDERERGPRMLSQAVRFPAGRPLERETAEQLGLSVETAALASADVRVRLASARLAYGVRIEAPGYLPSDNGFFIEPGAGREVTLRRLAHASACAVGRLTALNMHGQLDLAMGASPS